MRNLKHTQRTLRQQRHQNPTKSFVRLLGRNTEAYGQVVETWTGSEPSPAWVDVDHPERNVLVRTNEGLEPLAIEDMVPLDWFIMQGVEHEEHYRLGGDEGRFIFCVGRHAGWWWASAITVPRRLPGEESVSIFRVTPIFSDLGPFESQADAYMTAAVSAYEWCVAESIPITEGIQGLPAPALTPEQTQTMNDTIDFFQQQKDNREHYNAI